MKIINGLKEKEITFLYEHVCYFEKNIKEKLAVIELRK